MECETLICPFCGAPYREMVPSGTVQVKCRYCGGTILVPPTIGGEVRRCPNHPDVLAVGLCNDCGGSYCDSCLYFYKVENGTLHLCSNCLRKREADKAAIGLLFAVLGLFFGIVFIAGAPSPEAAVAGGVFFIGFFALPSAAWWVYKKTYLPEGVTLKQRTENIKAEIETRKTLGSQASESEVYDRLFREHMYNYGPQLGVEILERRINYYVMSGMTRSEAIRVLAEDAGY